MAAPVARGLAGDDGGDPAPGGSAGRGGWGGRGLVRARWVLPGLRSTGRGADGDVNRGDGGGIRKYTQITLKYTASCIVDVHIICLAFLVLLCLFMLFATCFAHKMELELVPVPVLTLELGLAHASCSGAEPQHTLKIP